MSRDDTYTEWREVGDRCFVRRYEYLDVSCCVVLGDAGALVVDTRASLAQGAELAAHVRELTSLPVRAVVNTHVHLDHLFGNGAFAGVPIIAHESVPLELTSHDAMMGRHYDDAVDDPNREAALATVVVPPDVVFASVWALDLGDRHVELAHLGRGHTAGDIVVRVPDADVVCAGDLVEESGDPSYGSDCYPMEWGSTLESLSELLGPASAIVPGHGRAVDKEFVLQQRLDVVDVAEQIREIAAAGLSVDDALRRGTWPYPREHLRDAITRGLAHASPSR